MNRMSVLIAVAALFALALLPALTRAADEKKSPDKSQDSDAQQAAAAAPKADAEGFIPLFNGKNLDGWKANEKPEVFKVENGNIVVNGDRSHLFYVGPVNNHNFKDFHFKAEVMTMPNSNSGIYFHTKYQDEGWPSQGFEAQVNNTYSKDPKKTGGLYGIKDVMNTATVKDNEWFNYDIIVKGEQITIKINDKPTAEWTQPADWKSGQFGGRRIGSGTFALQGHDPGSKVMYRNIRVKPL
jgi:hypothetical protein